MLGKLNALRCFLSSSASKRRPAIPSKREQRGKSTIGAMLFESTSFIIKLVCGRSAR